MRTLALTALLAAPALGQTWSVDFVEPFDNWAEDALELPTGEVVVYRFRGQVQHRLSGLDANGAVLWDRRYFLGLAYGIGVAPDGGIAVAGWTWPEGHTAELTPTGAVAFTRVGTIHGGVHENEFYAAAPTADGGWLFVGGNIDDECDLDLLVRRLDSAGNLLWDSLIGHDNFLMDLPGYDVIELADKDFLVTGRAVVGPYVMRFAPDGLLRWKQSYNIDSVARPKFDLGPNGTLFVVAGSWGASTFTTDEGFDVVALDTDGNLLWAHTYGGEGDDVAADVVATPDGGCLVVGSTNSFANAKKDMWLVRLDAAGDILWQHTYGDQANDEALSVSATAAGGFLVAGSSQDPSTGEWHGVVMKLDASGQLDGCPGTPTWAERADKSVILADPFGERISQNDTLATLSISTPDTAVVVPSDCSGGTLGTRYCSPGVPNSSGQPAVMWAAGSDLLADDFLKLVAVDMPPNQFGYFVTGMGTGQVVPPGSQGVLCLIGGSLHRYASLAQNTGAVGAFGIEADVNAIPGHGAIQPGETWNFQAWHRDMNPGSTSNFTDAVGVMFQ